jgi:hypothetical protein
MFESCRAHQYNTLSSSMKIKIVYTDNNCIDVQLNNSNAITKWFKHCKKINDKYGYRCNVNLSAIKTNKVKDNKQVQLTNTDKERAGDVYRILLDTVAKIKKSGKTLPFVVPDNFTNDQTILNEVHRYYTDNAVLTDHSSDFFKSISTLNYCVHELEDLTENTSNKEFVSRFDLANLWICCDRYPFPMDCWVSFNTVEQKENYNFFDHDYDYTVRLDRSILGKCVLQSFEDDDDPNAKDCTGRLGSFGGFFIDESKDRKKLYQSTRFKNWCTKFKNTPEELPLEFIIGHVSHSDLPLAEYSKKQLKNMEFII